MPLTLSRSADSENRRSARDLRLRGFHSNGFDIVQPVEVIGEVLVALGLDFGGVWTIALRRHVAVTGVKLVDDLHAVHDLSEGREALTVECAVIRKIDEYLSGAGIGPSHGVGDRAAPVALLNRVI